MPNSSPEQYVVSNPILSPEPCTADSHHHSSSSSSRIAPPLTLLGRLRGLGQIIINLRRPLQYTLSTILCVYTVLDSGSQGLRHHVFNFPQSAANCDHTCDFLCHLNQSQYVAMDRGVRTTPLHFPGWAWVPLTVSPQIINIRTHPNETWWLDPREIPAYCQWTWNPSFNEEAETHPVLDQDFGAPDRTTFWPNLPGKYYGTRWDEAQNIMALKPDSAVRAIVQTHVLLHYLPLFLYMSLLALIGFAVWEGACMSFYPFGTLRYALRLESLVNTRTRKRLNMLCVVIWAAMCLIFYVLAGAAGAGLDYIERGLLLFLMNAVGCYSLVTEVYAVLLVPEESLRRSKHKGDSSFLAEHVDTTIIDRLSLGELLRIRSSIWAVKAHGDEMAKPAVPAASRRCCGCCCCCCPVPSRAITNRRKSEGPRPAWLSFLLKHLNLVCSLKEHWLLWCSLLSCSHSLLGMAAVDSSYAECLCRCGLPADSSTTFRDCYQRSVDHTMRWLSARGIIMPVLALIGLVCVLGKLGIDRSQVEGVSYGCLEYVLRLELRKRSPANRLVMTVTSVCVVGITAVILIITSVRISQDSRPQTELIIFCIELAMQALACFILWTEVGFLTPASTKGVPEIHLPMRWYNSSDVVLTKLMKLVSLDDSEILALPGSLPGLADRRLSRDMATGISPADLLTIKNFLRREGLEGSTRGLLAGSFFRWGPSTSLKVLPAQQGASSAGWDNAQQPGVVVLPESQAASDSVAPDLDAQLGGHASHDTTILRSTTPLSQVPPPSLGRGSDEAQAAGRHSDESPPLGRHSDDPGITPPSASQEVTHTTKQFSTLRGFPGDH